MNDSCGECKYFLGNTNSITGKCNNEKTRIKNKNIRTILSKKCNCYEDATDKNNDTNLVFDITDSAIIDSLLYKLEKEHINKTNRLRAKAIQHLLTDYKILKYERNNR